MFDDFVRTSNASTSNQNSSFGSTSNHLGNAAAASAASPQQQNQLGMINSDQQGFERDGFDNEAGDGYEAVTALETGFISSDLDAPSSSSLPPIFDLGRVQYEFPAPLARMTVSSNILTMCLYAYPVPPSPFPSSPTRTTSSNGQQSFTTPAPPRLVRINLDDPTRTIEADVPLPPAPRVRGAVQPQDPNTMGPHQMFTDPQGRHTLLSMRSGDNFYWTTGWKKAKILPKLKGIIIESVAWNKIRPPGGSTSSSFSEGNPSSISRGSATSSTLSSTREILIGTKDGDILELILSSPLGGDGEEGDFLDRLTRRTGGGNSSNSDVDKFLKHVYTLPERQPVTGLSAEPFPSSAPQPSSMPTHSRSKNSVRAVVIATTSTRIYEFVGITGRGRSETGEGDEGTFDKLFAAYRADASPHIKSELPGDLPYSELHTWSSSERRAPKTLAWLTGPGVFHGFFSFGSQEVGDGVIDSANLLPYPAVAVDDEIEGMETGGTVAEIPLSICLTEFHFILLYRNRVHGIRSLDDTLVYAEELHLRPNERVISTAVDPVRRTYWIYSDCAIYEFIIKDEDRDVWRVYLERGNHEVALNYAKNANQRDMILSSQGDRFFNDGRFIQAAQCYAQTVSRTFEEIVLAFVDKGERDALRYYLVMRLERLRKSDEMQRVMLATWLVEIYLAKINELEDVAAAEEASQDVENYRLEQEMLEEELRQFLVTYKSNLDRRTTFSLLARHGRTPILLHYASIIGDNERIVRHWVQEEEWEKAIDAINRQSSLDLYYRFAPVLMRNSPSETVTSWQRQSALSPRRLIPAMLQHRPRKDKGEKNEAVRYLRYVIEIQGSTDSAVHNFILTLLAADGNQSLEPSKQNSLENGKDQLEIYQNGGTPQTHSSNDNQIRSTSSSALLSFIDSSKPNPSTGLPYYDLDYALRTCASYGRVEACIRIYAKMGLYESAVELALGGGDSSLDSQEEEEKSLVSTSSIPNIRWTDQNQRDIELACSCAELVEGNDALRKKLWLRIAKFVVKRRKDIKAAMEFLSLTPLLSIEDILPFFPDFFIIDDFKSEICLALEGYASRIEELKSEMDEATRSAESIRKDMDRLGERFVTIEQDEKCGICSKRLMDRGCYVFPCRHGFHADCLIAETTRHLPQRTLRRILELQESLSILTSGLIPSLPPSYSSALASSSSTALGAASSFGRRAGAGLGLDKLREYVLPDVIVGAISTGVSVSVEGGRRVLAPLDPFTLPGTLGKSSGNANGTEGQKHEQKSSSSSNLKVKAMTEEEEERVKALRDELDGLVASSCVICEGSVAAVGRGFIRDGEEVREDWSL